MNFTLYRPRVIAPYELIGLRFNDLENRIMWYTISEEGGNAYLVGYSQSLEDNIVEYNKELPELYQDVITKNDIGQTIICDFLTSENNKNLPAFIKEFHTDYDWKNINIPLHGK